MHKSYAALPLRAQEDVIEEFGVSRKYTYLLIIAGLVTVGLAVLAFMTVSGLIVVFDSGAGALAPLLAHAVWMGLAVVGFYLVAMGIYLQLGFKFFLTNQRVIEIEGFLAQRTASSDYGQINDIVVRQDFINRLFLGTGTIGISTPGTSSEEYQLINVDRPVERRELLRDLIRATQRGEHVDKYMIAHLMKKNGFAASEQEALDKLDLSVGKDPLTEAAMGETSPAYQEHRAEFHEQQTKERMNVRTEEPATAETNEPKDTRMEEQFDAQSEASQAVGTTVGPAASPSVLPSISSSVTPTAAPDEGVEDLLGDGIDESDRLRAAQKRLDQQGKT